MLEPYEVVPGAWVLPSFIPLGPLGLLPLNAYFVDGRQPYLVDTGQMLDHDAFLDTLEELIDPRKLSFIYLTHTDPDHVGALATLMNLAPKAVLLTSFIGFKKLEVLGTPIDPNRVHLLNPGEQYQIDGHRLTIAKPPVFDAPETTAVYDSTLDVLFSADSFGAPVRELAPLANDLEDAALLEGQVLWATLDSPWLHDIDRARFGRNLEQFIRTDPEWICSAHLPPARNMVRTLCMNVSKAPDAVGFVAPTHEQFQAMLRGEAPAPAP